VYGALVVEPIQHQALFCRGWGAGQRLSVHALDPRDSRAQRHIHRRLHAELRRPRSPHVEPLATTAPRRRDASENFLTRAKSETLSL
jgi:hypothetical protein